MGAKLCCIGLTKSKKRNDNDADCKSARRALQWQDLHVPLAPNVHLNRVEEQLPAQSLMSVPLYLRLQRSLPLHVQRRKVELVYASWEHGFSLTALKTCMTDRRSSRQASVNQEVLILIRPSLILPASPLSASRHSSSSPTGLSSAAGDGRKSGDCSTDESSSLSPVIGAFLPNGIDFHSRKYHGADTMFVFTNITEVEHSPSSPPGVSNFFVEDEPTVYPCPSPKVNEYFVRTTDGMIVFGGGGKGAAIAINDDLDTVSSSFNCPTFGAKCLLPAERGSSSDVLSPCGVLVEGFTSKAPIHTMEVWGISNYPVTIPDDCE